MREKIDKFEGFYQRDFEDILHPMKVLVRIFFITDYIENNPRPFKLLSGLAFVCIRNKGSRHSNAFNGKYTKLS